MTAPAQDPDPVPDPAERHLLLRVLGALLREDVAGLRSRSTEVRRPDGRWLRLPVPGGALALPVTADGFQSRYTARLPLLRREPGGSDLTGCDTVLAALRDGADPADRPGFDAFAEECREALAALRLHGAAHGTVLARLAARYGPDPARWRGPAASLAFDTLAAHHDHPVYPTSRARAGLTEDDLRAYAPEFHPRFRARWVLLPRAAVTVTGTGLPEHWPGPAVLGHPGLEGGHLALPVHPLTAGPPLREALRAAGLDRHAVLAERPYLTLAPTLSTRTAAVLREPTVHLKLPLPTATLGLRNRRTVKPGTLTDGAACQRLLAAVIAAEPRFSGRVLLADETSYAHAGHELLAVLIRRHPPGLDGAVVVPMAALTATAPGGRLVLDHLADRFYGGDPRALFDAWLTLLFDWQTTLFAHGIALESHQQNISLALDTDTAGRTRLRLVLRDNDGPRVNPARLPPGWTAVFDDPRILAPGDGPLADLFTTITVHLCAGAYAFTLARLGRAPLSALLDLVRDRLAEAVARLDPAPAAVLRARVLDAPHLPVKAMVTAGTLLTKERSGAADINKHYTTGPNYLRHRPRTLLEPR